MIDDKQLSFRWRFSSCLHLFITGQFVALLSVTVIRYLHIKVLLLCCCWWTSVEEHVWTCFTSRIKTHATYMHTLWADRWGGCIPPKICPDKSHSYDAREQPTHWNSALYSPIGGLCCLFSADWLINWLTDWCMHGTGTAAHWQLALFVSHWSLNTVEALIYRL